MSHPLSRPRRNRSHSLLRHWSADVELSRKDLVYPVFIMDGQKQKQEIKSMPGQYRWSIDGLLEICEKAQKKQLGAIALFPAIEENLKNPQATEALNPNGLICRAAQEVKKRFPELLLISDIALDPFSSDGHDGLVKEGQILNDETVEIFKKMALLHAQAGFDVVAPSDMMDGRVKAIRESLDQNNQQGTLILSYCAKYASAFYGPFREALASSPKSGDKKTYQMNPAAKREALIEMKLDTEEGADILMVKPALAYLDIIHLLKENSKLPIAAYNVSGEYSMIKAASLKGWIDEAKVVGETLLSIKRAGANIIFTYFALDDFII